jgi:hypothetical protein
MQGLDREDAPAVGTAKEMLAAVGGGWWNVYIGGPEFTGTGWTPQTVASYVQHGIDRFMLTYVGRQKHGPLTRPQGVADGHDALRIAHSFGYTGTFPICLDVELSTFESAPSQATEYAHAWCETVRDAGALPGVYANPSTLEQFARGQVPAAFVWIASWVSHAVGPHDPHQAASLPTDLWAGPGQRAWQYAGEFGGKKCQVLGLDVDINVADPGLLAHAPGGQGPAPPPSPAPHPTAPPPFPGRVLRAGMFGDDVRQWQAQMQARGWHIKPSGTYDAGSESICGKFQADKHLGVTGNVDAKTWAATWTAAITP